LSGQENCQNHHLTGTPFGATPNAFSLEYGGVYGKNTFHVGIGPAPQPVVYLDDSASGNTCDSRDIPATTTQRRWYLNVSDEQEWIVHACPDVATLSGKMHPGIGQISTNSTISYQLTRLPDANGDGVPDGGTTKTGACLTVPPPPPKKGPCAADGYNGCLPGPTPQCTTHMKVVFFVYTRMSVPKTNGCWTWINPRPYGGIGVNGGRWNWCGNGGYVPGPKAKAPGYWVYDDTLQHPSPGQIADMAACGRSSAVKGASPAATVGFVLTAYRPPGPVALISAASQAAIRKASGADTFFAQLYLQDHPVLTESVYGAWSRTGHGGKHQAGIGILDVTRGFATANTISADVLRLCRDSRADGMLALNAGTGGGGKEPGKGPLTSTYLAPIENAMKACTEK